MSKRLSAIEQRRDPRALLDALRSGSAWFQSIVCSGIDTSAHHLRAMPNAIGGTPYCFLVLCPDPDTHLTPFHFHLHESDVQFHVLRGGAESLDDTLASEVSEKLTNGRFELVVVLGVLEGPSSERVEGTAGTWFDKIRRAMSPGPSRDERKLRRYRERLLQVGAMAAALRVRLSTGNPRRQRVIEGIHDCGERRTFWDVSGLLEGECHGALEPKQEQEQEIRYVAAIAEGGRHRR